MYTNTLFALVFIFIKLKHTKIYYNHEFKYFYKAYLNVTLNFQIHQTIYKNNNYYYLT